jgi:cold shock CspA family protein
MTGTIIRVYLNKGYGFLRGGDGVSRFFHANDVQPAIQFDHMHDGQGVEFTPAEDLSGGKLTQKGNGFRAAEVRIMTLEDPGQQVVHE